MLRFLADNWWYILLIGLMAHMMFRGGGCCGGGHSDHGSPDYSYEGGCCGGGHKNNINQQKYEESRTKYTEKSANMNIDTAQDPVCGMVISKADSILREINGKTYYFCNQNCANEFERKHLNI